MLLPGKFPVDFSAFYDTLYFMTTSTAIETKNVKTLSALGHPAAVSALASLGSGVVLVSGRHGSGKSVTLASLALEVVTVTGRKAVDIVATDDTEDLGIPKFVIKDRPYKRMSKKPKNEDVEAAVRYSLITAANIIESGAEVAVFDDIRHAEAGLIATYLAQAGLLVLASIHNSGEAYRADDSFTDLRRSLNSSPRAGIVKAIVHQELKRDGTNVTLSSGVYPL